MPGNGVLPGVVGGLTFCGLGVAPGNRLLPGVVGGLTFCGLGVAPGNGAGVLCCLAGGGISGVADGSGVVGNKGSVVGGLTFSGTGVVSGVGEGVGC